MDVHRCQRDAPAQPERVLDLARATLAAAGFRVGPEQAGRLVAEGRVPSSTKRQPLTLASRLVLRVEAGRLEIEAELGGLRWFRWFLWIFPLGLGLLLSASFWVAQRLGAMPAGATWVPLLAVSPWLVLAPLMTGLFRRRAVDAVERLADSLASA